MQSLGWHENLNGNQGMNKIRSGFPFTLPDGVDALTTFPDGVDALAICFMGRKVSHTKKVCFGPFFDPCKGQD